MDDIQRYKTRLEREKKARKEAENLLREKAHELYFSNEELKKSKDALEEENTRRTYDLIRVQHLAKVASWRWDIKKNKILWSEEIENILELNEFERSKENFWNTIYYLKRCDKIGRKIILNFLRSVAKQKKEDHDKANSDSIGLEHDLIMPSSDIKKVRMVYECTYNEDDEIIVVVGTVQDITRQKNYEKILLENEEEANERVKQLEHLHGELVKAQVQADLENKRKSEFLSTVNHELRTPLTSIHGALELIKSIHDASSKKRETADLVDIAHRNSERLKFLINDILDTEKIDSGNIAFNFSDYELANVLENCIELNQPYAQQHSVQFNLSKDIPDVAIRIDTDRFTQVMTNLLSNAAKFSHENGTIDIKCNLENDNVCISVQDYGLGIPDNFKDTIFQKFAQADMSNTRKREGTGLGLYITKSIIERHKGSISYKSKLKEGTTFYIRLPYIQEK